MQPHANSEAQMHASRCVAGLHARNRDFILTVIMQTKLRVNRAS